jgi:colanic acid biosynthesis glycosyl transferase WcaI
VIPEAARHLAHRDDIVFVVCGDGALKGALQDAAHQLPNLKLLPLQPYERLGELLGLADMHLLPQSPQAQDLVLPSKLSGMLASGRPVIATCQLGTEIANVVCHCGLVVPPQDSQLLANAIERMTDNADQRHNLGHMARNYADRAMNNQSVLSHLERQLHALLSGAPLDIRISH